MNTILPDALEDCLQRLEQGETLDSVLALHPSLAAQLRPLLEMALRTRSSNRQELPMGTLARQRARGLALAADLRQGKNRAWIPRGIWRPAIIVLAVIAVLVMSTNSLLIASAHAVPGDTLYPLKRSVESTQLRLASNPVKKQALEKTFSNRRVEETKTLIHEEKVESVDFTGVVSSLSDSEWLVSGIPVRITSRTVIDKGIVVGSEIEVSGTTNSSGGVDAANLGLNEVHKPDSDPPEASPTQPGSSDNDHPENNPTPDFRGEEIHPVASPTQTTASEDGHLESSPTQSSHEEGDPENSPTQISPSEGDHQESSPTRIPSPEGDHSESSPTRTPSPAGHD